MDLAVSAPPDWPLIRMGNEASVFGSRVFPILHNFRITGEIRRPLGKGDDRPFRVGPVFPSRDVEVVSHVFGERPKLTHGGRW